MKQNFDALTRLNAHPLLIEAATMDRHDFLRSLPIMEAGRGAISTPGYAGQAG
jgi:hypothetical protein